MHRYVCAIGCSLALIWCLGCGKDPQKKEPPKLKVSGTVLLDGKPMPKGEIWFSLPGESENDLTEIHYRDYEFFRDLIERGNASGEIVCPDTLSAALALQGIIDINIVSFLKMNHDPDFLSRERAREITKTFLHGIGGK